MNEAGASPDDGFALSRVTVQNCEPSQLAAFRDLNLAWIRRYFAVEAKDRTLLDDPKSGVLDQGGIILVATWNRASKEPQVIGTCALLREDNGSVLQLSKMAVDERFQGKQVGNLLGQAAIDRARQAGASLLRLETNSKLTPAIRLYEKLGFVHMPPRESAYTRADVQMVIEL
ncbi:MAG: putative acetyltransferase [Planctomycetota bacterium]|jgi:putative acetyltransferase